jgi:hypothetical protein
VDIEQRHGLIAEGKLKPEAFNAREWAQVRRNTALYDALEAERTGSDGGE